MQKPSHSVSKVEQARLMERRLELAPGRRRLACAPLRPLRPLEAAAPSAVTARRVRDRSIVMIGIDESKGDEVKR
jgi:hypothetical protein